MSLRLQKSLDMRMQAQALDFNRSGKARTRDYEMVTIKKRPGAARTSGFGSNPRRAAPKCLPGRGGYKKWTGSAICQSAYAPAQQTCRSRSKADGASHGHSRGCGMFTAGMTVDCQTKQQKRRREESLERPFKYYMTNNMFDETKLFIAKDGRRAKRRRTLAQACEITYAKPGLGAVQDIDIIRPPALVERCTAASCAGVVGQPKDPVGILPDDETLPKAAFYGFLTATDSHSVNKLISKWIAAYVNKSNKYQYAGPAHA